MSSFEKNHTRRAVLCYDRAVHIEQESWDRGWGCGYAIHHMWIDSSHHVYRYRNFLMACTALMDQPYQEGYISLLDSPLPPSVKNLQTIIEEAWKHGHSLYS